MDKKNQFISQKNLIRILWLTIICLTLTAGYYQSSLSIEQKKYKKLEDMYVRVRAMIGREEMQRLIDLSKEVEEQGGDVIDW